MRVARMDRQRGRLENRLGRVVGVAGARARSTCMVKPAFVANARQNSSTRLAAKSAPIIGSGISPVEDEIRPAGDIDDRARQCFIERRVGMTVPSDAGRSPSASRTAMPDHDADVFDRMMRVDFDITGAANPRSSCPWRPSASSM